MEAEKTAPETAREAVDLIGQLFVVEKQAKDVSVAERLALRETQSALLLAEPRRRLPCHGFLNPHVPTTEVNAFVRK